MLGVPPPFDGLLWGVPPPFDGLLWGVPPPFDGSFARVGLGVIELLDDVFEYC